MRIVEHEVKFVLSDTIRHVGARYHFKWLNNFLVAKIAFRTYIDGNCFLAIVIPVKSSKIFEFIYKSLLASFSVEMSLPMVFYMASIAISALHFHY